MASNYNDVLCRHFLNIFVSGTYFSMFFPVSPSLYVSSSSFSLISSYSFQNQSLFRRGQCLNTPEIKILFISVVYIIAGVFVLVQYGQSVSKHNVSIDSLLAFGVCQLNGNDPSCPKHAHIVGKTGIALNIVSFSFWGLHLSQVCHMP